MKYECLGLVHWDDPEGCYGGEDGGGFRMGNTCIPVVDSCWYMANQYNIVKLKNKIKLKKKKYECLSEGKEKRNENKEKYIYIQISNKVSDDTVQIGVITSSNR